MKNNVIGVFVLENQVYEEISYSEFLRRCSIDEAYKNKHFIYVSKRLMEVSHDDYVRHYKELEHIRYLKKLDIENGLISMENMDDADSDYTSSSDYVPERAEIAIMMKKLSDCLLMLTDDELELIKAIFFDGVSEREYAQRKGIYHNAVHKKKVRILKKLKDLMEK